MTIFFPDVSDYQSGLTIQPGTVAVVAKATQGESGMASSYAGFKAQAASVGAVFSGYHFLEAGNGAAQAQHYFAVAGETPCMIDCEQDGSSSPDVQDCLDFKNELESLGGRIWAVYFPNWYRQQIGSPDLTPLAALALVASDYNAYSDSSSGWDAYGGVTPAVLQFSDTFSYGGMQIDFNAYRGTVQQFADLVNGAPAMPVVVTTPVVQNVSEEEPMQIDPKSVAPYGQAFALTGQTKMSLTADGFGAKTSVRFAFWASGGVSVENIDCGGGSLGHTLPAGTTGVTVSRNDTADIPVGIAFF